MTKWKIYNQDVLDWAKEYKKGKFHALLCDPPYHLESIVKRFGKKDSAPAKFGEDGVYSRSSKGFMGQTWDGGDLAFRPELWSALGEHLYPGAFGMAFSAARNWHRMAVAIEDAGFILHPTIFLWAYGQGFPKATNISSAINRQEGRQFRKLPASGVGFMNKDGEGGWNPTKNKLELIGEPSDLSEIWKGHRYGLQALKPAVEPIIVFQKPYDGRAIDNITQTGAGALNIDAGRIPTKEPVIINRFTNGAKPWGDAKGEEYDTESTEQGRWPANFILTDETAKALDAQTGTLTSGKMLPKHKRHTDSSPNGIYGKFDADAPLKETIGDSGGASRFFYTVQEKLDESDPVYYCSKVSPKERNAGLDELPDQIFAQSGGAQAKAKQGEDEYKQDSIGINRISTRKNIHPTVKPIDLARYLASLLLPPDAYAPRRLLVPFAGSGSELIGGLLAGWEQIVGIELTEEYVPIAEKRLEYWSGKRTE